MIRQRRDELVMNRPVDEDTLRRDARLAGVAEAATLILDAARRQSLFGSITTGALFPSSSPTRLRGARSRMPPPDRRRTRERDQRGPSG